MSAAVMSIRGWRRQAALALAATRIDAAPALEADVLLCHVLAVPRTWLYTHADDALGARERATVDALLARRLTGEPIAYLTGEQEFRSRTFRVTPDVLIPRDDTDTLVEAALQHASTLHARCRRSLVVVDAGTGSGIVAISLALELEVPAMSIALDRSVPALRVAACNATLHGANVQVLAGDWLAALADRSVDLLISNPPYIETGDPHLAALGFEPREALVAGDDGLQDIRRLTDAAVRVLRDEGVLLLEHGFDQAMRVRALLGRSGYTDIVTRQDGSGNDRVTGGSLMPR